MARVVVRHVHHRPDGTVVRPSGSRAVRSPPKHSDYALSLMLEHHLVDFKRGAKGQITQVKHMRLGWMSLKDYYDLSKLHDFLYTAGPKIVEGGYRVNRAIYDANFEVAILGFSIPVPLGYGLIVATVATIGMAVNAGDYQTAAILVAALALPFGALYLVYLFVRELADVAGAVLAKAQESYDVVAKGFQSGTGLFGVLRSGILADPARNARLASIDREIDIWRAQITGAREALAEGRIPEEQAARTIADAEAEIKRLEALRARVASGDG